MSTLEFGYRCLNQAGYRFFIDDYLAPIDLNNPNLLLHHKDALPDVRIERPRYSMDERLIHSKCLVTVNGYIHLSSISSENNKLYIRNATRSMLKSKSNKIGILNFTSLSEPLYKIPITQNNILRAYDTNNDPIDYYDTVYLHFPNVSTLRNPILIFLGYMIRLENNILERALDPKTLRFSIRNIGYIEKLYELQKYRDIFKELNLTVDPNSPTLIDLNEVRSDSKILLALTSYNTFLVDVPVNYNTLTYEKIYLERSEVPHNFRTAIEPKYPIIVGRGKIGEYIIRSNNDKRYTVYVADAYYDNYVLTFNDENFTDHFNTHRVTERNFFLSHGFFLRMTGVV